MKLIITDLENFQIPVEGEYQVIKPNGDIHHCIGCFGCWVKTPGECVRAISYIHPDFVIRKGEMHHKRRYQNVISLSAHLYGENITDVEKETARELMQANADNYDGLVKDVSFYRSIEELEGIVL